MDKQQRKTITAAVDVLEKTGHVVTARRLLRLIEDDRLIGNQKNAPIRIQPRDRVRNLHNRELATVMEIGINGSLLIRFDRDVRYAARNHCPENFADKRVNAAHFEKVS